MSTYTISDIHGCYAEFMELLEKIRFDPQQDAIYILGDAIDRGKNPIDCLRFIMKTKNIHFILGNHEQMMLEFYDGINHTRWLRNGCAQTVDQLEPLPKGEQLKILTYLRNRPLYKTVSVNDHRYFLSHAGLEPSLPFSRQPRHALIWSREAFYLAKALPKHTCIFGHTPTRNLHEKTSPPLEEGKENCAVWYDTHYNDKICIDCGCVYGGALAALRLDDGEVFYVASKNQKPAKEL